MRGVNTLTINHATLCEALRYWLNNRVLTQGEQVEVTAVKAVLVTTERPCVDAVEIIMSAKSANVGAKGKTE